MENFILLIRARQACGPRAPHLRALLCPAELVKNTANRDICPADLYAPLFIGVPVGVTAPGIGMQEGGK